MEQASLWINQMSQAVGSALGQLVEFLPTLIGALVILAAGWLIARVVRSVGIRSAHWLNRFLDRRLGPDRAGYLRLSNAGVKLLGDVTFWVIILLFVTAATRVLGLEAFSAWLDRVVAYLPTLLAGGFIILVGLLVGSLAHDLTFAAVASAGMPHAALSGRCVQAAILMTALVLGLNQIGIDVTLLTTLIAILVGAAVGSLALAFALGAGSFVGNLIGAHYLQQHYRPGQQARIGEVEGEILELTPVSVILATEQGRVMVPAKVVNDQPTTLLSKDSGEDDRR
jgi:Mechanosensitive ion channel, conserved TM helix